MAETEDRPSIKAALLNFEDVKQILPQKYPFIFIDRVLELEKGKRILCLKNVAGNEPYFEGHFPQYAIMPGALILEALAQAAIILFRKSATEENPPGEDPVYLFGAVKGRMLRPVVPGDQLMLEVVVEKMISTGAVVNGTARVDGRVVTKSSMTFGIARRETLP